LLGKLLAPGGGFIQDGAPPCPFSILGSTKDTVEVADVQSIVEVFNKLIRRYKYLQKPFEENCIPQVIQYLNKFDSVLPAALPKAAVIQGDAATPTTSQSISRTSTPTPGLNSALSRPNQDKLAVAMALFISNGIVSASVLANLKKDHLVKDGTSLAFMTTWARAFLQVESVDHLAATLRRSGVADVLEFFPANRRTPTELSTHFRKAGLEVVADFYHKQRSSQITQETLSQHKEMVAGDDSVEEIMNYLKEQSKSGSVTDVNFVGVVWQGLISNLDMQTRADQLIDAIANEVKTDVPILAEFCKTARTEVALINAIQAWCYDNSKIMGVFPKLLKLLYGADVLSDEAIIYWHSKGSKLQARQYFLKLAEPLVNFLKSQEDEDEDEENEE